VNSDGILTVTETERSEIAVAAAELVTMRPCLVADPAWVGACRTLSCAIPQRVRQALRDFRYDPGVNGRLLLRGLPVGTDTLPPTPATPESVERTASPGASVIAMVSLQLGEVVAYRGEKGGALIQNVVPVPGREDQQSNAGSATLEMHVENAFHPDRPDYVALLCVRCDHDKEAGLQVASIRRALVELPAEARRILGEPRFVTETPPSFGAGTPGGTRHPVLTGDLDDPDVRVDFHASHPLDDDAHEALAMLRDCFERVLETIWLAPGDLALVDNRIAIHGRTCFKPRYDGRDRWLHRTFVHVDHRRSRASRAGGGFVIG